MKTPANIFKALADETRLRILALLLAEDELCVCDIISAVQLPQSTVSRHLAYLRKSGLVNDRRCGLWMYYSIASGKSGFHKDLVNFLKLNITGLPEAAADLSCLGAVCKVDRCN